MSVKILDTVSPGVVTGKGVQDVFAVAKANGFALPAVNIVGSSSANAVMEAAKAVNSPVIIQFSNGGALFNAGKGLSLEGQRAAVLGSVAGGDYSTFYVAGTILNEHESSQLYDFELSQPGYRSVQRVEQRDSARVQRLSLLRGDGGRQRQQRVSRGVSEQCPQRAL